MRGAKSQLATIMIPVSGMQQRLTWHVRHADSEGGAVTHPDEQC
ncbi:hypothetical protein V1282_002891 [Nitrobacteraceae bacterium AZCC 2146]